MYFNHTAKSDVMIFIFHKLQGFSTSARPRRFGLVDRFSASELDAWGLGTRLQNTPQTPSTRRGSGDIRLISWASLKLAVCLVENR